MPPFAEISCRQLLNHMETGDDEIFFGPVHAPHVDVVLPLTLVSRGYHICHVTGDAVATNCIPEDRRCALSITAPDGAEFSSWYAIWTGRYTMKSSTFSFYFSA